MAALNLISILKPLVDFSQSSEKYRKDFQEIASSETILLFL